MELRGLQSKQPKLLLLRHRNAITNEITEARRWHDRRRELRQSKRHYKDSTRIHNNK